MRAQCNNGKTRVARNHCTHSPDRVLQVFTEIKVTLVNSSPRIYNDDDDKNNNNTIVALDLNPTRRTDDCPTVSLQVIVVTLFQRLCIPNVKKKNPLLARFERGSQRFGRRRQTFSVNGACAERDFSEISEPGAVRKVAELSVDTLFARPVTSEITGDLDQIFRAHQTSWLSNVRSSRSFPPRPAHHTHGA
jgi:hypothetical protein